MKKLLIAMAAVLLGTAGFATTTLAAIEVGGDAYIGVYDKYLWRGINLSNSQPVAQGGVDVSVKGFTLSYWTNVQLSEGDLSLGRDSDEATETDLTLDYTFDIGELVSVSVGDIYYTFNVPGSTHELYLGLALNTILSPVVTVYYDWDAANSMDLDGVFYNASVSHTFEIMKGLGLNLGAAATYNQESPFVGDYSDWHNYELSASADYAFNDQLSLTPSLLFSDAIGDDAEDAGLEDEILAGLSLTLTF